MAFSLADELVDPLADDLDMHLGLNGFSHTDLSDMPPGPGSPTLGTMELGSFGGMGMSLADELDGPGPDDLGAVGGLGMGSLALELEQNQPEPVPLAPRDNRASPVKASAKANGGPAHGPGRTSPGSAPATRGGARRRSPGSSLNGTPTGTRRRTSQSVRAPALSLALTNERERERPDVHPTPQPSALSTSTSSSHSTSPADPFGEEGVARAEAEAATAHKTMQDALASSASLVGLLKGLDRPVSAGAGAGAGASASISIPRTPATATGPASTSPQLALLEDRLQAHLARLSEAERLREEQAREAARLARELENVRWEGLNVDLAGLAEQLAPSASSPPTPGWTGELADKPAPALVPASSRKPMNGFAALETIGEGEAESPATPTPLVPAATDPISPISPLSPTYPGSPTTPTAARSSVPPLPLPQAAASLVDETAAMSSTLGALNESLSLSLARHAADGRTLRRARAGLKDWHDREAAEETCRRGIDAWESRVARGEIPDARAEMQAMLQGFRDALAKAEAQVYQLHPVRAMEIGMAL